MSPRERSPWLGLSLGVLAADQTTKLAVERATEYGWSRTIIPGFFELVHTRNRGIAFGLLSDANAPWLQGMLILFSVAAAGIMAWLLLSGRAGGSRTSAGLALILGGALGNMLDRAVHGSVVDFILLYFRSFHWPAFNLADSAIVIGAGLVLLDLLRSRHELERAKV